MKIIRSKYTSEYLKSLIQKGESRIETELLEKFEKKVQIIHNILMFFNISSPPIILCAAIIGNAAQKSELPWLFSLSLGSVFAAIFALLFAGIITVSPFEDALFRHYSKNGHILENPYDEDFQEIARLVEIGEQLDTLSLCEDNFVTIAGQYLTVCSSKNQTAVQVFDLDESYEDIIRDDCLDFSGAFDQDIEEYIRKAGDE